MSEEPGRKFYTAIFPKIATTRQKAAFRCLLWAAVTVLAVFILAAPLQAHGIFIDQLLRAASNLSLAMALLLFFFSPAFLVSERRLAVLGLVLSVLCFLAGIAVPTPNF